LDNQLRNLRVPINISVVRRFSLALIPICIVLSSCNHAINWSNNDPFEPLNRSIFKFNDALDQAVVRPTAVTYKNSVPDPIRSGVTNVLKWLQGPTIITNDIMQGDLKQAQSDTMRFFMNTTSFGIIDAAADFDMKYRKEDFGQTLGLYGVPAGPYIMLPFLGPSNVRDAVGRIVDHFLNPFSYIGSLNARLPYTASKNLMTAVNFRAANFDQIDDLRSSSLDAYAKVRTIYSQQRQAAINNGRVPVNLSGKGSEELFDDHLTFTQDKKIADLMPPDQKKNNETK
jgi:phospholipid-binding lipoprotein MlaA